MTTETTTTTAKGFDLSPQNFEQALTFSKYLSNSDRVPKDFKGKPENCLIAMQWGYELGMQPLQAIQNIAVINGRPAVWGDALIAIVRSNPLCEYVREDDDGTTAYCRVKRRGEAEQVRSFSADDARTAGLTGKQGPWTQYPKRMRQLRARAFALRDVFPDVLRGMPVAEEVIDTPTERHMGHAEVVQPAQQSLPAPYSDAEFDATLPKWKQVITSGRKTVEELIFMASLKQRAFTEVQQQQLRTFQPAQQQSAAQPQQADITDAQDHDDAPEMTYAQVADRLHKAADMDELANAGSMIALVRDPEHRSDLAKIYDQRAYALQA